MLDPFVQDYIKTQGTGASVSVASLFEGARLERRDVEARFTVMQDLQSTTQDYQITEFSILDRISSSQIQSSFNLAVTAISDLFKGTNDCSLISDNYATVLFSRISNLDDSLNEIEKLMGSFGAVLAGDQGDSFIYVDSFSDNSKQDLNLVNIPDRDGIPFSFNTAAQVRTDTGVAVIPTSAIETPLSGLQAQVVKANFPLSAGDKNIQGPLSSHAANGWSVLYRSTVPMKTGLIAGTSGAQVMIDLLYPTPIMASEINVTPSVGTGQQIVSLVLHAAGDAASDLELAVPPLNIGRNLNLRFSSRMVQRVTLVLNQPIYKRLLEYIHFEETNIGTAITILPKTNIGTAITILPTSKKKKKKKKKKTAVVPRKKRKTTKKKVVKKINWQLLKNEPTSSHYAPNYQLNKNEILNNADTKYDPYPYYQLRKNEP